MRNRRAADILRLCYEGDLLTVVRHPDTGKNVLVVAIKFNLPQGFSQQARAEVFSTMLTTPP